MQQIDGFSDLPRVTSDSKPFRAGGKLFVCTDCSTVQKTADAQWLEETGEIYRGYDMYHQSASNDQPVFDPVSGQPRGRCEVLSGRLRESGHVAAKGALLDVGAGSGAMLGAFSSAQRSWQLFGLDLDDRKEKSLKAIPRFEQLFTIPAQDLPRQFDLITLIHSLEHFTEPLEMLKILRTKVSETGHLFVQVNNVERTPFDLIVADHLCHFSPKSLACMAARAGLNVRLTRTDWVYKEISLLASSAGDTSNSPAPDEPQQAIRRTKNDVAWLRGMMARARECAHQGEFGIFGTSVAATWLAGELGEAVKFFIDEDPARENRPHLGKPIFKPANTPQGATVYLPFVPEVSASIEKRLASLPLTFVAPPKIA